jgi:cobalt-zinc-cadmium efflux system membrane fusion protein
VTPDNTVELREVKTALVSGQMLQVTAGLTEGERIVTKGSLFIDRLASGEGP